MKNNHQNGQATNIERLLPKEHDWLSDQFKRLPYMLYEFWLIVNVFIVPLAEYFVIRDLWKVIKSYTSRQLNHDIFGYTVMAISFILLFLGVGGMLLAILQRRSATAQKSFFLLQLSMVGSLVAFLLIVKDVIEAPKNYFIPEGFFVTFILIPTPIIHLFGGSAVLEVFKKNHPLVKQSMAQNFNEMDPVAKAFYEQNQTIASELLKYDQLLTRWLYFIYKWWLKLVAFLEIMFICGYILNMLAIIGISLDDIILPVEKIVLAISSLFLTWSCFLMGVAITTKSLVKSKRAIFLFRISLIVSIIGYLLAVRRNYLNLNQIDGNRALLYSSDFAYYISIPVICLFGAQRTQRVIEQRDNFARVSSYSGGNDNYL